LKSVTVVPSQRFIELFLEGFKEFTDFIQMASAKEMIESRDKAFLFTTCQNPEKANQNATK